MKDALLQIRVDEAAKGRWRSRAKAADQRLSDWVRQACERHVLCNDGPGLESSMARMRRLANRLNAAPSREEVAAIASELRTIVEALQ
ncbi:hypothetical protein [Rhodopseudomonas sp.]|uniref:hypothetical protein n=1 Tax=Rhodopseudomonas sp. TaxID=1078 RepID=UPI0039E537B9